MRELTKSMASYTWAMSVFGVQQVVNILTPGNGDIWGKAAQAFDNVTGATTKTFGRAMTETFKAGDSLQRGMVDVMFASLPSGLDPTRWIGLGARCVQRTVAPAGDTTEAPSPAAAPARDASGFAGASGDWGPMPR